MTRLLAERIMGLSVREIPIEGTKGKRFSQRCFAAYDGETEIVRAYCSGVKMTIARLVDTNYKRRSEQRRKEQGYRCFTCGRVGVPLSIDHIRSRGAHGRDDGMDNLRAMCSPCHDSRHHDPGRPPRPHPEVLKHMREHGWEWLDPIRGWGRINDQSSPPVGLEASANG